MEGFQSGFSDVCVIPVPLVAICSASILTYGIGMLYLEGGFGAREWVSTFTLHETLWDGGIQIDKWRPLSWGKSCLGKLWICHIGVLFSPRFSWHMYPMGERGGYMKGGLGWGLTAPISLLPASLWLSRDLSLSQASPAPSLHPVNIAVCFLMNMDFHHLSL